METTAMRRSLMHTLTGIFVLTTAVMVTILLFVPFLPFALAKAIIHHGDFQRRMTRILLWWVDVWVWIIGWLFHRVSRVQLVAHGMEDLRRDGRYLLLANHQSWADIPVLACSLRGHAPFPRFFIKHELIWFPVIGFVCWALDFPFMRRFGKKAISRHPELKGVDVKTTHRACGKYRHIPVTAVSFAEGTRCTAEKRRVTKSPYRHLMRPKAGGTAFMIVAMEDVLTDVLDVTIAYADSARPTLWDYASGRLPEVTLEARLVGVPRHLIDQELDDEALLRRRFQNWMNQLWRDKDARLDDLLYRRPVDASKKEDMQRADAA